MKRIMGVIYDVPYETKRLKKKIRRLKRLLAAMAYVLNHRRGRRRR